MQMFLCNARANAAKPNGNQLFNQMDFSECLLILDQESDVGCFKVSRNTVFNKYILIILVYLIDRKQPSNLPNCCIISPNIFNGFRKIKIRSV